MPDEPFIPCPDCIGRRATAFAALKFSLSARQVDPAVQKYLDEIGPLFANGGVQFVQFSFPNADEVATWLASFPGVGVHDIEHLLSKLAGLSGGHALFQGVEKLREQAKLQPIDPFVFDAELARLLFRGGAYLTFAGKGRQAKALAAAAAESLLGDSMYEFLTNTTVFQLHDYWSQWFISDMWCTTFLVFDLPGKTLSVLATTDTD